jgi:hypothetical protein
MVAYVGWGTDSYGAGNAGQGEYDTAFWFTVTLGLPVWSSFRGCYHVIRTDKVLRDRLDGIRSFGRDYLGWADAQVRHLPPEVHIPLRPAAALKWQGRLDGLLWLLGAVGGLGLLATLAISQQPNPFRRENLLFLVPFWAALVAFVPALAIYLVLRRPSARQARIRAAVADRLGPYSDVAGWMPKWASRVAENLGVSDPEDALALVEEAERRLEEGEAEEALLLARVALAQLGGAGADGLARRAEEVTDDCLRHLGRR